MKITFKHLIDINTNKPVEVQLPDNFDFEGVKENSGKKAAQNMLENYDFYIPTEHRS